jgi:hypothetical protein
MWRVAAGELDEGNRLNDPHSVVEILLTGVVRTPHVLHFSPHGHWTLAYWLISSTAVVEQCQA